MTKENHTRMKKHVKLLLMAFDLEEEEANIEEACARALERMRRINSVEEDLNNYRQCYENIEHDFTVNTMRLALATQLLTVVSGEVAPRFHDSHPLQEHFKEVEAFLDRRDAGTAALDKMRKPSTAERLEKKR